MAKLLNKTTFLVICFYCLFCQQFVSSRIKFTNVVCNLTDPTFAKVETCSLKAVSRHSNYLTIKVILLQLPVTDFELRIQFMKKANGWKPFLYDITVGCNFTKHLNSITTMAWNVIKNVSNVKHDCPYNQIIEAKRVDNVYIENVLKVLPIPTGEYAVFSTWKAYNITRVLASAYVVIY